MVKKALASNVNGNAPRLLPYDLHHKFISKAESFSNVWGIVVVADDCQQPDAFLSCLRCPEVGDCFIASCSLMVCFVYFLLPSAA